MIRRWCVSREDGLLPRHEYNRRTSAAARRRLPKERMAVRVARLRVVVTTTTQSSITIDLVLRRAVELQEREEGSRAVCRVRAAQHHLDTSVTASLGRAWRRQPSRARAPTRCGRRRARRIAARRDARGGPRRSRRAPSARRRRTRVRIGPTAAPSRRGRARSPGDHVAQIRSGRLNQSVVTVRLSAIAPSRAAEEEADSASASGRVERVASARGRGFAEESAASASGRSARARSTSPSEGMQARQWVCSQMVVSP